MTSSEIRHSFLDFFKSKQHTIVPSSSLMPDSPNLLFTNAGMNQFVPIFLGQVKCPYNPPRAADTQKCIRAGGKHNDLDDVGLDTYHHTFFEMLGNWSFGDYFKKEAIDWAWELVTEIWKFPRNRLYATVYSPDKSQNDPSDFDQEAYDLWAAKFTAAGLDPKIHIVYGNKKDNFWMMGETGPCGPCSELHVDLTPAGDTQGSLVNKGDPRCIEIWNLVFIQFNANPDGTFSPLPARHVDTGMGFERATSIIQCTKNFTDFTGIISNYETDIFRPIFDKLEKMSGKKYCSTLPGIADPAIKGSTGDSPVPVSDPPTGMGKPANSPTNAGLKKDALSQSTGLGARYSKRNLPHFEKPWAIYHLIINTIEPRKLSAAARDIVFDCILHWRDLRYQLVAGCVMPDHVHMIIQPGIKEEDLEGKPIFWPLSEILHSIKSYSAKEVNKLDNVKGSLWQRERYDRYIRGDADLEEKFHYICRNPWAADLVQENEPWPWLWTPDIEAWKPYVPLSERKGSTGDSPVPVGDPPAGTSRPSKSQTSATLRLNEPSHSEGSTGDPPVPVGDPPTGSREPSYAQTGAGSQLNHPSHSAGPVAQRHGQVAHATHSDAAQLQIDIAFRVIADHIRTLSFAIADGIQPGNTDRNYVLRRILRRAVRYGRTLGFHEPFFYKLVDVLGETMGDVFPEIRARKKFVSEVIRGEEETFNKTLDTGLNFLEEILKWKTRMSEFPQSVSFIALKENVKQLKNQHVEFVDESNAQWIETSFNSVGPVFRGFLEHDLRDLGSISDSDGILKIKQAFSKFGELWYAGKKNGVKKDEFVKKLETALQCVETILPQLKILQGEIVFKLYDTYGFPLDLTELIARERGFDVDKTGFETLMDKQRKQSQAAQKKEIISLSQIETSNPTTFVGYENLTEQTNILEVVPMMDSSLEHKIAVVLDRSPFYAEMGGQVGDSGDLRQMDFLWHIVNTQKSGNVWLHFLEGARPGEMDYTHAESPVTMLPAFVTVNKSRREAIQRHHTVTHLLHWALHEVVSKEASQKGSFVGPDKLTFDFNSAPLTTVQIANIEKLVNEKILENEPVFWGEFAYSDVKGNRAIMQFFGDKYGDTVRVVQIGGKAGSDGKPDLKGYSMELCGGTHTRATGEIGSFKIVSESAVAAGVRRIEAVAGLEAYRKSKKSFELNDSVAGKVNSPVAELEKKIDALLTQQKELEKSLRAAKQKEAAGDAKTLLAKAEAINGIPAIITNIPNADGDTLQTIADALKSQFKGVIVLGGAANGAVSLVAAVSPDFTAKVQAGKIIQAIAPIVGGKGGGKPDNARGGGKDTAKLDEALAKAKSLLN